MNKGIKILLVICVVFTILATAYVHIDLKPKLENWAKEDIDNTSCLWLKSYIEPYEDVWNKPIEYKYAVEKYNSPECAMELSTEK